MAEADMMVCLDDFQTYASKHLAKKVYDYYSTATDEEISKSDNILAFKRFRLIPRVLRDVSNVDLTTTILDHKVAFPVGIAPTAFQRLAHPDGECATAKAAGSMGVPYTVATYSTSSMAEVLDASSDTLKFFQIYIPEEKDPDRPLTRKMLKQIESNGFKALVLTVDSAAFAKNRTSKRNKFLQWRKQNVQVKMHNDLFDQENVYLIDVDPSLTWEIITWLKSVTSLPIVVKGILSSADAALAAERGVAAVWVSNHGGRQLDTVPATIDVLESVVRAVAGRCEVYMDGGVRLGTDVFKAVALGARAVFIGKPILFGLAYDGMAGVRQVLEILKNEFFTAMALSGCSKFADINRELVLHQSEYCKL